MTATAKFEPTREMVQSAASVFMAMAWVAIVKPVVEAYQTRVLKEGQWRIRPEFAEKMHARDGKTAPTEEVITNPQLSYLMSEEDFAKYHFATERERTKAGLAIHRDGNCPLLEAENLLVKTKHKLVEVMAPVTKISLDAINSAQMDDYKQYIELTLRLLSPYVEKASKPEDAIRGLLQSSVETEIDLVVDAI